MTTQTQLKDLAEGYFRTWLAGQSLTAERLQDSTFKGWLLAGLTCHVVAEIENGEMSDVAGMAVIKHATGWIYR